MNTERDDELMSEEEYQEYLGMQTDKVILFKREKRHEKRWAINCRLSQLNNYED